MSARVHVFGSLNLDLSRRVARFPGAGETLSGVAGPDGPGGKGLNQAVAAARSGASVLMHGALGDDASGVAVRESLQAEGIDGAGVAIAPTRTGTAIVITDDSGENLIVLDAGANARAEAPDAESFAAADVLLLQAEVPWAQNALAIQRAHEAGATVVLTPAPVADVGDLHDCAIDILIANQHEAAALAAGDPESAAAALSRTIPLVIVTLGADGVMWAEGGEVRGRRAAVPTEVVDTTAAGDTVAGAFAAQMAAGVPFEQAIDWALRAAAITVSRSGSAASIPTAAEIRERVFDH